MPQDNANDLIFSHDFTDALVPDPDVRNATRQVLNAHYSWVSPTQVSQPKLVAVAPDVAQRLGMSDTLCASQYFADVFSGHLVPETMKPFAMCYGGHQFGHWAGQLGDGRAINLGEMRDVFTGNMLALQLKGAGPTPYSRFADGRAVLRSSVREFLCSEAMHHLGVPTTRALSLVLTGDGVVRDILYDGHPREEPGAVVCRVAPSFVRFGNFEIFAARGDLPNMRCLLDWTVNTHFDQCTYASWFHEVCRRTAVMIAHWMRVGFVHGVMNTDNMSILGLTIDYGPYGWMENYDPDWTPNITDKTGRRYRFSHQPEVAYWNLGQLARAIAPLVENTDVLSEGLKIFADVYSQEGDAMMAAKLGFVSYQGEDDAALMTDFLKLLYDGEIDMTIMFRALAHLDVMQECDDTCMAMLVSSSYQPSRLNASYREKVARWYAAYRGRVLADAESHEVRVARMNAVNPKYVLRNYLAQEAIDHAENGDFSHIHVLAKILQHPYDEQPEHERYAQLRPEWAKHRAGCSMLSCSS